jgi:MFS transporter, FHS family, glucose/mannose:H+ symporter
LRDRLYAVACASMLVYGIVLSLPGTVLGLPETAAELGLTLTGRGSLISALFVGLLFGSLLSGPIVDALGYRASLAMSSGLVALAMPLLAVMRTPFLAGMTIVALGVASAGMNTASNALSADLFPGERATRMNRLAILVGIGGVLMPVTTVVSSVVVSWRTVVVAGGVLAAMVAFACAWIPAAASIASPPHSLGPAVRRSAFAKAAADRRSSRSVGWFARQPGFIWLAAALLLGGGNEAALAGWISTYLQAAGFSASASTWILASHWLGLIAARVTLSPRVERSKAVAVVRSAVVGAVGVAVFVLVGAHEWLAVMPFVIGCAIALVVPTMLALAGDRYPGNMSALFGLLLTLLQVGGIALPAAIGFIADRAGLRAGLSLIAFSSLFVALFVRLAPREDRVESSSTSEETA